MSIAVEGLTAAETKAFKQAFWMRFDPDEIDDSENCSIQVENFITDFLFDWQIYDHYVEVIVNGIRFGTGLSK